MEKTRNITDCDFAANVDGTNILVDDNGELKKIPTSSVGGGGSANEDEIIDKITNPDKYTVGEGGGGDNVITPAMEVGGLDRSTGAETVKSNYSRTAGYIAVGQGIEYTFSNTSGDKICLMCYDADKNWLSSNIGNGSYGYVYLEVGDKWKNKAEYGVAFIRFYNSKTSDLTVVYTMTSGEIVPTVPPLEHDKVYFPNGYSMSVSEIDPGLYQLLLQAVKDSFSIVGIRAPESSPHEATLALLLSGTNTNQFADLSCMRYDESAQGQVCLILQKRGEATPLPYFFIGFNDGIRPPRVQKFRVNPDCVPMRMTSQGIEVRRNNTYDNDWLPEETVVVNLADIHDKVEKMYAALVADGTVTE